MAEEDEWQRGDFSRRQYGVQQSKDKEFDKAKRIGVKVIVDGRTLFDLQLREPGMIALVSRPDDPEGFSVEIVQPGSKPGMGPRYTDYRLPDGSQTPQMEEWMYEVLGL